MQINPETGEVYDARMSKDGVHEYTLMGNRKLNTFEVDCWRPDGSHHWNKSFTDETKAVAEFNRFE